MMTLNREREKEWETQRIRLVRKEATGKEKIFFASDDFSLRRNSSKVHYFILTVHWTCFLIEKFN